MGFKRARNGLEEALGVLPGGYGGAVSGIRVSAGLPHHEVVKGIGPLIRTIGDI